MKDETIVRLIRDLKKDMETLQADRVVYQSRGDREQFGIVEGKLLAYQDIIDRLVQEL